MAKYLGRRKALKDIMIGAGSIPLMSGALSPSTKNSENKKKIRARPYENKDIDKPISVITLGAGSRGNVYGDYGIKFPNELDIVGVAEPIKIRNERYVKKHNISAKNQDPDLLSSTIDASIESHVMGFMAEKSRLTKQIATVEL